MFPGSHLDNGAAMIAPARTDPNGPSLHDWLDRLRATANERGEHTPQKHVRTLLDVLSAMHYLRNTADGLMPLCPCDLNPETSDGPQQECPVHGDGATFVEDVQVMRARLAELEAGEATTEWAARWTDGGYCPSNPPRSEEFARQHARMFGTTPIRRTVGQWVVADTGELAFPGEASS